MCVFVFNISRPYNYKVISKIKNKNRASNERYNFCEFLKFPIKNVSLLFHFFSILRLNVIKSLYFCNLF